MDRLEWPLLKEALRTEQLSTEMAIKEQYRTVRLEEQIILQITNRGACGSEKASEEWV